MYLKGDVFTSNFVASSPFTFFLSSTLIRIKNKRISFKPPMDCAYQPNDVVPVAVGVTLAVLVVLVLVAYLFGRRRARQRGYQSV